jgi:hypothetical protein
MGNIIKLVITLLAGVGGGAVLDKFAADKLPAYPSDGVVPKNDEGKPDIIKIAWFIAAAIIGTLAVKFIGKKLNIKILK